MPLPSSNCVSFAERKLTCSCFGRHARSCFAEAKPTHKHVCAMFQSSQRLAGSRRQQKTSKADKQLDAAAAAAASKVRGSCILTTVCAATPCAYKVVPVRFTPRPTAEEKARAASVLKYRRGREGEEKSSCQQNPGRKKLFLQNYTRRGTKLRQKQLYPTGLRGRRSKREREGAKTSSSFEARRDGVIIAKHMYARVCA